MEIKQFERFTKIEFLILVNTLLLVFLFFSLATFPVNAVVGEDNVTVITLLEVGNTFPEVLNVSIQDDSASFDLTPNATTTLSCVARIRDFNNESDFDNVNATFYRTTGALTDPDDNNNHYTNGSCSINNSFVSWNGHSDDIYTALANCTYEVEYYADPGEWDCSVGVNDTLNYDARDSDNITVNQLLALALPDTIDYGVINATDVSNENITNVSNAGNVQVNLSLYGFAYNNETTGAGYAMNCTGGSLGVIDINYEKYNLTTTTAGDLTLTQFENTYTNLTSSPVVRQFELNYRQNDVTNDAINSTYWRMYVPQGVAGNCSGSIVFGATQAVGS